MLVSVRARPCENERVVLSGSVVVVPLLKVTLAWLAVPDVTVTLVLLPKVPRVLYPLLRVMLVTVSGPLRPACTFRGF